MKVSEIVIEKILRNLRSDKCTLGNAKIVRDMARAEHLARGNFNDPSIHFKYELASFMELMVSRYKSKRRMSAREAATRINNLDEILAEAGCIEFKVEALTL